jgi:hypothetical protein
MSLLSFPNFFSGDAYIFGSRAGAGFLFLIKNGGGYLIKPTFAAKEDLSNMTSSILKYFYSCYMADLSKYFPTDCGIPIGMNLKQHYGILFLLLHNLKFDAKIRQKLRIYNFCRVTNLFYRSVILFSEW